MEGWCVELLGWPSLPRSLQRCFVRIVGDWNGEWWGLGRAEFGSAVLAEGCMRELARDLRHRARLVFWVSAGP
jgi:hypothetical protein